MFVRPRFFTVLLFFCCFSGGLLAQPCTELGQTPSTAFPVCGTTSFAQHEVPICGSKNINVPGCSGDGAGYGDKNPYWYKFTCYTEGTLGFVITPNDLGDDYDWQLFDITGHNPDDVFTDVSLVVTGNWSGSSGKTGAASVGVAHIQCASDPGAGANTFAQMPVLKEGHEYLLMVSHYTDSQSGYDLSFEGGNASITDPSLPGLLHASAACGGSVMRIKLNKEMKCSTLAPDGSDFQVTPSVGRIVSAVGINCSNGFDMDSVELLLDGPIAPGNYTISMKNGRDRNTLLDNCDRAIDVGANVPVTVYPIQPTPMDSIKPVGCAPDMLELVFLNNIRCSTIAANGSDFRVTGPVPVTVVSAAGVCTGGLGTVIQLQLSRPIVNAGAYTVTLQTGTDGNTIFDECRMETPAGETVNFNASDTVNAGFDYHVFYGCNTDTVAYTHNGNNGVNNWLWTFDGSQQSNHQSTVMYYNVFGTKTVQLAVSNGVCSDTAAASILLDNTLLASFTAQPQDVCPEDVAIFINTSVAKNAVYAWDFGDGNTSALKDPPEKRFVPPLTRQKYYAVKLTVTDEYNCTDTASVSIRVLNNCIIAVPSAFTPNNDGLNDYLYPLNAYKATNLEFRVFNRLGQLVYFTQDWTQKWNGTYKGTLQPPGVYAWMLTYTHRDTGEKLFYKGTSVLIR
ncbi:gliding motility-associated C-terminal domain-containing protein [Foetidibacter luteolus]|uniref:T9SS type B sorting domain-containing protein n=1 Tax=Foetidibacter luteolus TaxID=2608880 RepID=UPI00129B8043